MSDDIEMVMPGGGGVLRDKMPMSVDDVLLLAWLRKAMADGTAKAIREACHLSCREVAEPVGVDQASLWRWEQGTRAPGGEPALAYARLLKKLERIGGTP